MPKPPKKAPGAFSYRREPLVIVSDVVGLNGEQAAELLSQLDSLNYLDVQGIFYDWDTSIQDQLLAWDEIDYNTLVIPEPGSILLLGLGGLMLCKRRQNIRIMVNETGSGSFF